MKKHEHKHLKKSTNRNKHKHILSPLLSELKIRTALDLSKTNMTSKTVYGSWPPLGCQHPQSCVCSDRSSPSCIPLPPGQTQGLLLILMEPRFRGGGRSTALKAWLRQNGGLYWSWIAGVGHAKLCSETNQLHYWFKVFRQFLEIWPDPSWIPGKTFTVETLIGST